MLYEWRKIWVSLRTQTEFLRLDEGVQLTWFRLILVGSDEEGVCPPIPDLAWEWRVSEEEAARRVQSLVALGWVRVLEDARLEIVKWAEFQGPDSDATRSRRRRERMSKVVGDTKRDESDTRVTRDRHDGVTQVTRDRHDGVTQVTRLDIELEEKEKREEKDTLEPSRAPGHTRGIPPPPAPWVPGFWLQGTQKIDLNGSWAMDQAVKRSMDRYGDNEGEATLRVRHILGIQKEAEGLAALAQILATDGRKQMELIMVLSEECQKSKKRAGR